MSMLYACGSNQFNQLSISDREKEKETNNCFNVPILLLILNRDQSLLKAAFTWSRLIATLKKDEHIVTLVSGYACQNNSNMSDILQHWPSSDEYPDKVVTHVTDTDIYLSCPRTTLPSHVILDGDNELTKISIDKESNEKLSLIGTGGTHKDTFIAYNEISFGKFDINEDDSKDDMVNSILFRINSIDSGISILELSCGKEHVLLLSKHGTAYSYGIGSRGQLGHGTVETEKTPRLVEALEGVKVTCLAAGGWHSAAVVDGDLYTWGWNESGQLGLPTLKIGEGSSRSSEDAVGIQAEPRCTFDVSEEISVTSVSCGSRHTLCLTVQGSVLASGWNSHGQLGLGHTKDMDSFTKVPSLKEPCTLILASQWNSMFLCKYPARD